MSPWFLGAILVLSTMAAHADDPASPPDFVFGHARTLASATQAGDDLGHASSFYTPDGGYAAFNAVQIEVERQQRWAAFRERIYEAIGIADYIPRGSFLTGGLKTNWHLTATTDRVLEFSLDARW
jgi:hypothetical protein